MLTIGLLWHSTTSDNLGVGALTLSQLALLERISAELNIPFHYKIFGTAGQKNYLPEELRDKTTSFRFSFSNVCKKLPRVCRELKSCDIVLDLGEGDSFTDIYGKKRFIKISFSKLLVLFCGTPLILSPQTIGPFNSASLRKFANYLISRSQKVFARDELSYDYLHKHGLTNKAVLATDLAFALPFEQAKLEHSAKIKVGLNASALLYSGGYTKKNQFNLKLSYPEFVHLLIEKLIENNSYEVHLCGHVLCDHLEVEDDYRLALSLKEHFPQVTAAPKFSSPTEAKSYISAMDFFIGSRMHATIAALSCGVPVIPVAYSRKFTGLFSSLAYSHTAEAAKLTKEEIVEQICESLEEGRRAQIKEDTDKAKETALKRLLAYESSIHEELRHISESK